MSFLRNSNISVKTFQKTKIVIKWHTAIEFQKIASGENLKILGRSIEYVSQGVQIRRIGKVMDYRQEYDKWCNDPYSMIRQGKD